MDLATVLEREKGRYLRKGLWYIPAVGLFLFIFYVLPHHILKLYWHQIVHLREDFTESYLTMMFILHFGLQVTRLASGAVRFLHSSPLLLSLAHT